ncbi:DUF2809 domain-containing protein [Photobacterium sp. 1_MG-2023]|uniref:ribosomal maturation YjgA family protein n=1 Tax=Photobacterium sp. 1_MG-2023 TaxID=3062646 RepID=UPI0026E369B3|nr:DUF2809 domain-containing protein [Photobacterium sp. 1_MG-2023]MDO6706638.1 DUF2809 domain-containing protein [Photobacterium sp. 1_MG-2023]
MIRFSLHRCLISLTLLAILVFIALYVKDSFIRPFIGDVLVVIWIYACVTTVVQCKPWVASLGVLLFAYSIEWAQYVQVLTWLGLADHTALRIIFGATFDWLDLLAYTIGCGICLLDEHRPQLSPSR